MQIKLEQLAHHLESDLKPVYLISGDEPFLTQEASQHIREAAKRNGFTERQLFQGEDPDFSNISATMGTMSLFADKTVYEYRLDKLPGAAATQQIQDWCDNYQSQDLLIMISPRLDKKIKQKAWFKAVSQLGVTVDVFAISSAQLPGWLNERANQAGLNLTREALNILCQRTEGNLLAANQEIQRLSILASSEPQIDATSLREFTADNARFGQFELIDTCLAGDATKLIRMLRSLREEGVNIIEITAPLNAEIRKLCRVAWTRDDGVSLSQVYNSFYIWRAKQFVYNKALNRYPLKVWQQILNRLMILDKAIKGQDNRDPWLTLESILLVIAGQRRFSKFISDAA